MGYPKTIANSLLYVFLGLILRKIVIALIAMNTVRLCWDEVSFENMIADTNLQRTVREISPQRETFVLILNKHALNMTFNWLCNTEHIEGVHESALAVTLDAESSSALKSVWPHLRQLNYIVPSLKDPFNYGDGYYQLFYFFRANLARALLHYNATFWMIQQDTFWSDSLANVNASTAVDIVFDRASEGGPLIAGGYYRAQPTLGSKQYFDKLSYDISWWYAPDNAYMTSLCELSGLAKCGGLPFSLISNWQWLMSDNVETQPKFIQFDGETKLGGKLAQMKKLGFYFLQEDGHSCNASSVDTALHSYGRDSSRWESVASYSHKQFAFYQKVVDTMYSHWLSSWLLNRLVLPYAHFCMLSL